MDDLRIPPGPGCPRGLVVPAGELIERFSHASGPGGQGVNTADSRVQLSLDLRASLVPPTPRRPTKPTRGSKLRRLADKKRRSEVKARRRRPDAD